MRAVVRYDPRPFFVRALDAAIGARWCDAVDVDRIEIDIVNMAFRYHTRMGWDIRDYATVQTATEIVLMYVDDGLRLLSGSDVDRAAWLIVERPLTDFFRASWGEVEANRHALAEMMRTSRMVFGHDVTRFVGAIIPEVYVNPNPRDIRDIRSYSDVHFLEANRSGSSLGHWREHIRMRVVRARERLMTFRLLPMDDVRTRWAKIGEGYALFSDGTFDVFLASWLGACIRMCTRGDLGVVVRVQDVEQFLCEHVERARGDGRFALWMGYTIDAATDALAERLGVRGDAHICEGIRHALEEAMDHLGGVITHSGAQRGAKNFPVWVHWWQQVVFLELTDGERARVIGEDDAISTDEVIMRLRNTASRDDRIRLLDALDFANANSETILDCFCAAPDLAEEICARMDWNALPLSALRAFSAGSLPTHAMRAITRELVMRRTSLHHLPPDIVFDCLLQFADDPKNGPALRRRLFTGWGETPEALLKVFRDAESNEERAWWVQFALESPEHFAYIVADALPYERTCIASVLEQGSDVPKLDPQTVVETFRWMEERVRQSKRRRTRTVSTSVFIDADVQAIWSHLSPTLRDAVHTADTEEHGAVPQQRRKKVVAAKK